MSEYARPLTPYLRLALGGAIAYVMTKLLGTIQAWTGIQAFSVLTFLTFLAAAILGGIWFGRVGSNLDRLDRGDRSWNTALGVVLWYVPLVNLFLPFFVVREMHKASHGDDWRARPVPGYLNLWWGLWALAGLLVVIGVIWGIAAGAGAVLDAGSDEAAIDDALADVEEAQFLPQAILSTASTVLVLAALPLYLRLCRELASVQDAQIAARYA